MLRSLIVALGALILAHGGALAETKTLTPERQVQFINALAEISMPARAYQQIVGLYQQLLAEQERERMAAEARAKGAEQ